MPLDYEIDGYLCAADATIDQVHPRKDILLVRRIPDEEITASGLVVPDSARNPAMGVRVGEVLKCGPGDTAFELGLFQVDKDKFVNATYGTECRPGDRILYHRVPDNDVNIGGVDCVLLREEQHVLAVLEPDLCSSGRESPYNNRAPGGCSNPAGKSHTCPYREEIHNDHNYTCECCKECTRECAMDI